MMDNVGLKISPEIGLLDSTSNFTITMTTRLLGTLNSMSTLEIFASCKLKWFQGAF
jgi:hypothetical protein